MVFEGDILGGMRKILLDMMDGRGVCTEL